MAYFQRETRELVGLDSCELIRSQFDMVSDYWGGVALDFFAEVTEQLLPDAEPNEKFFRLLLASLDAMRPVGTGGRVWRSLTYFSLWAVRLAGWLPDLRVCLGCGSDLEPSTGPDGSQERAFFTRGREGLICRHCRAALGVSGTWELSAESRVLAAEMLRKPVSEIPEAGCNLEKAADLRRFLVQQIESHVERRLVTASALEEGLAAY
jgi:DNA repair protein RecO (recombination protein O)